MNSYTHNTGTFIGKGGTEIFFQNWCVDAPRGILVIAHGVGEHSGRYGNIISEMKGSRISIYALDHRGHGRSSGKRGHVDSFMDYVYDLKLFIDLIREENNAIPLILLGHSMGGVIACKYALEYADDINGLILSSPGVVPAVHVPAFKKKMSGIASKYAPALSLSTGLDASCLSHDASVVDAYENDRLVHDKVTPRWFVEFVKAGEECINRSLELRMPLFVFSGKDDRIVDYRGCETLYNNASSINKELHLFEGLYHETMNESDNKSVLKTVSRWIMKMIAGKNISKKPRKKPIKKLIKKGTAKKKSVKKTAVRKKVAKKAAKKKAAKKTALKKRSVAKAAYKVSQRAPKKLGAKKNNKKRSKKTVATKKTAKKTTKKAAKKTAKKAAKKKK